MHNISRQQVLQKVNSNQTSGLSKTVAEQLLIKNGKNQLIEKKPPSIIIRFLHQFKDFMVIVLIVAAIVSYLVSGHAVDSLVIMAVVLMNAILGVTQESKAEKSLEALKKMAAPSAKVLRDHKREIIPASELVVGDIIFIDAGDLVPADARILECANLKVEESALTGESLPVEKIAEAVEGEDIPLGDRKNMLYSSTIATYGRATAVVVSVGMATEAGKIAHSLAEEKEEQTPLQKRLTQIGSFLGVLAIIICIAIFAIGIANGTPFIEIFMTAVTLAVAAIPEGLPAIVTIVLSMGVSRLVKKNAIIRKLPAVETLGSASVVCSDKTGTLTQNRMTVVEFYKGGRQFKTEDNTTAAMEVLVPAALCCDGTVEKNEDGTLKHVGDPTETAIVAGLLALGSEKKTINAKYPRIFEIPFDSDRKMMTTLHRDGQRFFSVTKGAVDQILARCTNVDKESVMVANKQLAEKALRVLAVAVHRFEKKPFVTTSDYLENNLEFVGLIGMIDPPREEARAAVQKCKIAGITPVMITGDHRDTAVAIANELEIISNPEHLVLTGAELDKLTDLQLASIIDNVRVYARVSPEHKIKIVKAWKSRNHIVAMTGDGVNDAPALKAADIGCAMGITGTEVSKGAADMILTDDNFATIPAAIEEGRSIYTNIKKCISFLLSGNLGEVLAIFTAMLAGLGTPLLPTQILWVNLITDSLPAVALGVEPTEKDIMEKPPLPANSGFFTKTMVSKVVLMGVMLASITLIAYIAGLYWLPQTGEGVAQTMAFMTLALCQLFHAFNLKSNHSLFRGGLFSNKSLLLAFVAGIALQAAVYYVPFLASVFGIVQLETINLLFVLALSIAPIPIMELAKAVVRMFSGDKETNIVS